MLRGDEEKSQHDDVQEEIHLPRLHVKHVIMKASRNARPHVQRINCEASASNTASACTATDNGVVEDRADCSSTKCSHTTDVAMQGGRQESWNFSAAAVGAVEEESETSRRTSDGLGLRGRDSTSAHLGATKNRSDSRWNRTADIQFQEGVDERPFQSERQIPAWTDDACRVSRRSQETASKIAANFDTAGGANEDGNETSHPTPESVGSVHRNSSDRLGISSGCNSMTVDLDGTKNGSDLFWNRPAGKLFQTCREERLVKSESQTPVSTCDPCRVSRTSSLDGLRLRFQQQKKTAGRIRADLEHLRKKVIETQHELDEERDGRRRLEEWTGYLESQLETYIASRSHVEKQ